MNIHGRCQSCIVNLNSHDTVLYDNLAPLAVDALVFRQQAHAYFDRKDLPLRFSDGQSQSVALSRARHRIPEFRCVLVRTAPRCALFRQARKRRSNNLVLWIQTASHAKENIGIDQTPSNRHLVVILIDPFAGDVFRQLWDLVGKLSQRVQPRTYLGGRARVLR